jgi:hypothetical protein
MAQRLGISHLTMQEGEMKELSITKEIPHNTASRGLHETQLVGVDKCECLLAVDNLLRVSFLGRGGQNEGVFGLVGAVVVVATEHGACALEI